MAFRLKRCDQTHTHTSFVLYLPFSNARVVECSSHFYLFCFGFYVNYIKSVCCCYSKVRPDHICTCSEQRTDTKVSESGSKRSTHVMLFLNANRRRTKKSVTACLDWIRNCENKANLRCNTTSHGLNYCICKMITFAHSRKHKGNVIKNIEAHRPTNPTEAK